MFWLLGEQVDYSGQAHFLTQKSKRFTKRQGKCVLTLKINYVFLKGNFLRGGKLVVKVGVNSKKKWLGPGKCKGFLSKIIFNNLKMRQCIQKMYVRKS